MEINININELICPTFVDIFDDIVNHRVNRAIFKGGRASTKSSFCGIQTVSSCMINRESAICLLKYNNRIKKRLCNLIKKSIRMLGVQKFWKFKKSDLEFVLLDEVDGQMVESGVVICCAGCENPDDLKSFTEEYTFGLVWIEELATFKKLSDIKNLIATFARGGDNITIMMSYNPPVSPNHWCNSEYNAPVGKVLGHASNTQYSEFEFEYEEGVFMTVKQVIHHSTWLDVPAKWLGATFISEARQMEKNNPKMYKWMYLGEIIGTDSLVFENIINWDGDTSDLDMTEIFRGLDHGFSNDPAAYVEWYYDRRNKCIYAINEFAKTKMSIDDLAFEIRQFNRYNFPVYADSASPDKNSELVNKGLNIIGADKAPDSIRAGVLWLQSLNGIYICASKTPTIYREFTTYEYLIDNNDNITAQLKQIDNHTIDATRYAFRLEAKYR